MQYLIYATIAIVGIIIGRVITTRSSNSGASKEKMSSLQKLSIKARSKKSETTKNKILKHAHHKGKITNDEVEGMFCGMSDSTARRYLNELEKEGKLKQVGTTGRGVHYVITLEALPPNA